MNWLRPIIRRTLEVVDHRYRRRHALQQVGPILFIGFDTYQGPPMKFIDGTQLEAGDTIGALHFNNAKLSQLESSSTTAAGLGFARLMFKSLRELAEKSLTDPDFSRIAVYHGVSGLPPHGHKQGFVTAPVPNSPRRRLQIIYLRLLIWAFAAAPGSRTVTPDPHYYWLTRSELLQKFSQTQQKNQRTSGRRLKDAATRPS